jgi:cytochrome c peroxidase
MHDGSFATLDEVIDFYDRGGARNPGLDAKLRPLGLTPEDRTDLRAFLVSLTGRVRDGQ